VILAALWALTAHRYGWRNENLLLLSPLCLLLIPVWLGTAHARWQPSRYGRTLALMIVIGVALAAFLHAFPALSQANGHWWLLLAPIHIALALSLRKPATR
jgi:ABC-type microcin C transport system permease subunit YejB